MKKQIAIAIGVACLGTGLFAWWWIEGEPQRIIDARRDEVEAVLVRVEAVGEVHRAAPAVEVDGFDPAPDPPLDFFGRYDDERGNVAILDERDLLDLCADPEVAIRLEHNRTIGDAACLVRTGTWRDGVEARYPESVGRALDEALGIEYVLVLRAVEHVAPVVTGTASFDGGRFTAEAHLYRLADARRLGGVRFEAASDDEVVVNPGGIAQSWLESNLWERAREALREALEAHLELVDPPFGN